MHIVTFYNIGNADCIRVELANGKQLLFEMRGYRVTKPLRTIVDLLTENGLAKDLFRQAFFQAIERGLILIRDTKSNKLPAGVKNTFIEWLKQARGRVRA